MHTRARTHTTALLPRHTAAPRAVPRSPGGWRLSRLPTSGASCARRHARRTTPALPRALARPSSTPATAPSRAGAVAFASGHAITHCFSRFLTPPPPSPYTLPYGQPKPYANAFTARYLNRQTNIYRQTGKGKRDRMT